jgi:hypothetical protein
MLGPACPVCSGDDVTEILSWHDVPVNNALCFASQAEAVGHPRGTLRLTACEACGFLFNAAFDEELPRYDASYIETQACSPQHAAFTEQLARRWIERYGLDGETALEIGCGQDAAFLRTYCTISGGSGIGVDPAVSNSRVEDGIELISARFDGDLDRSAAAVICRHTLEHIPDVAVFLSALRRWSERNPAVVHLFEVPDVGRILAEQAFWDVYYEHCSYFTRDAIATAFELSGFTVLATELVYDAQYIVVEARPRVDGIAVVRPGRGAASETVAAAQLFARDVAARIEAGRTSFAALAADGGVVVWQASSKAVSLLSFVGDGVEIDGLVDLNPAKHGLYLVGSGERISAPEELKTLRPAHVVVMNPIYVDEVRDRIRELEVQAEVHSIDSALGRVDERAA